MSVSAVGERLQAALVVAMKQRDTSATSALRTALSAIANAEAVPAVALEDHGQPIAGALAGLGAGDVDRRLLSEDDAVEIVRAEIAALLGAAELYDERGEPDAAREVRRQAETLESCLAANA